MIKLSMLRAFTTALLCCWLPAVAPAYQDAEENEAEEEHWMLVRGGDVHTGTGAVLRGADVLAKNGKIEEVGYEVYVPEGAEVVDATGMRVYPGLVAMSSRGLLGSNSDFADTVDPFNSMMVLGLSSGITSTGASNAAAKLKRYEIEGVLMRDKIFATFTWSARNASARRSLRDKLESAAVYHREYTDWQEKVKKDKELKEPSKRGVDTTALAVLRGEKLAKFNSNARDDLLGIARLAQQYGFRPVVEGCREGWTVADELGRAGAFAIVTPRDRSPKDERLSRLGGTSIENAAILHAAGVQVAIVPSRLGIELGGIVGRDIMHLPIEVGFAIRGGLPEDAALDAVTRVPARILGINHRVGSLEEGKDCDLIVTDGDVLHYQTFVQYTVVEGKLVYDKQKELYFAHIRPREAGEEEVEEVIEEVEPEEPSEPDSDG